MLASLISFFKNNYTKIFVVAIILFLIVQKMYDEQKIDNVNKQLLLERQKRATFNSELNRASTEIGNVDKATDVLSEELMNVVKSTNERFTQIGSFISSIKSPVINEQGDNIRVYVNISDSKKLNENINEDNIKSVISNPIEYISGGIFVDFDGNDTPDIKLDNMVLDYNDGRLSASVDVMKNDWSYQLSQEFKGTFVQTVANDGVKNHYIELCELDKNRKCLHKSELISASVIIKDERYKNKEFHKWNPKIDFGGSCAMNLNGGSCGSTIGLSLMSKGYTKDDLDLRFLRIGTSSYKNDLGFSFVPVLYNIGKKLPLIESLDVGLGYENIKGEHGANIIFTKRF